MLWFEGGVNPFEPFPLARAALLLDWLPLLGGVNELEAAIALASAFVPDALLRVPCGVDGPRASFGDMAGA